MCICFPCLTVIKKNRIVKSKCTSLFFPLQEKVLKMMYVWALCRDQEELNPYAAWRLLDISASSTEQIL